MTSIYSWSVTAASNNNADSGINWLEGQMPGTVNDSARAMMGRQAEWLHDHGTALTAGGTASALTVTANSSFTAYAAHQSLRFRATADNPGAATLNVNGIADKKIRKMDRSGEAALDPGDIKNGGIYSVVYATWADSAAGAWILLNPTRGVGIDDNATSTAVTIDSSGNVGVGTASPAAKFHVNGAIRQTGATAPFEWNVNSAGTDYLALSSPSFASNIITADAAGRVGIGSTPSAKLHVNSGATDEVARFEGTGNPFVSIYDGGVRQSYWYSDTNSVQLAVEASKDLWFVVNGSNRLNITTSGSVGIGNSSPADIFEIGDFSATGATAGRLYQDSGRYVNSSTTTTGTAAHNQFYSPNGLIGSIQTNGSSTAYNTTSDYRLKVTFGQITDATALDKVMALPIYDLAFKQNPLSISGDNTVDPDSRQISALAHEIQALFPWAVTGEKDATDDDGDPIWQMADPSKLVYVAFAAIQELKRENDALKSRIQAVEASLNAN